MSRKTATPAQKRGRRRLLTFLLAISFGGLAGGLVMYFVWNMLLQIPQQYYIMRKNGVDTGLDKFLKKRFGKPGNDAGGEGA